MIGKVSPPSPQINMYMYFQNLPQIITREVLIELTSPLSHCPCARSHDLHLWPTILKPNGNLSSVMTFTHLCALRAKIKVSCIAPIWFWERDRDCVYIMHENNLCPDLHVGRQDENMYSLPLKQFVTRVKSYKRPIDNSILNCCTCRNCYADLQVLFLFYLSSFPYVLYWKPIIPIMKIITLQNNHLHLNSSSKEWFLWNLHLKM